ncbi:tyrosine-type recombinase/integrase [Legionella spiritensis]|uniref:Phage related integrase n=1 Tax=Legionella spiritensis TaxID=452 RepID=A0A0W0Z454_LEGSP|nr:tyrosine-type recombinase/integrase [Legionella spiritensis]KTD63890.1 phage related integrase [Legionella spiritensis]SNV36293.1 phage related integrase [Legionella spiritensis]
MKINKSAVENLSIPMVTQPGRTAQKKYYDDQLKGFGIRVTSGGTKAFFVEKLINRKVKRITLGRYPELTPEMARKKALEILGQIACGFDPVAEKKAKRMAQISLKEVFNDYLIARKSLKPSTKINYEQVLNKAFAKWLDKPIMNISKDHVARQHEKLGQEHGAAYANLSMRVLRALFNFAAGQYEDAQGRSLIIENPVRRLSQTRSWYRVERRKSYIKSHELAAWYQAVKQLDNQIMADYLLLVLFTGLRRQEAATLKWQDIDMKGRTLSIQDTKNNETHTLPLSDFLYDLFLQRQLDKVNDYVFPGNGVAGHLIEPRKQMAIVTKATGIEFTVHDLRRTFITIAESLDIPAYALKRLLNHKMTNDVTAGYIIVDVERLRRPMQLITDFILKCSGEVKTADIIAIQPSKMERVK